MQEKHLFKKLQHDIAEKYLSVHLLIISFFSLHFFSPKCQECNSLSCIPKQREVCRRNGFWIWVWLGLGSTLAEVVGHREFVSLWENASYWCVAAVAVQVSASRLPLELKHALLLRQWRKDRKGGMEGDGLALPSGSSHATEHSVRELLFMYGEFTRLKCLDWVNYSFVLRG